MICKRVTFRDFRNIKEQEIVFDSGINVISGNNAQGKTSALEGIYLTAQGRSHRTAKERDFIRFGCDFAEIFNEFSTAQRQNSTMSLKYTAAGKKYCRVNGVPAARMSEFIGNFRAIIFTPEHLSIVKDGPSNRRFFLDAALSQISPRYVAELQNYNKNLIQRNKLLSSAEFDREAFEDTIGLWSENLALCGEKISEARAEYVEKLGRVTAVIFNDMTGGREKVSFRYRERRSKEELDRLLSENLDKELRYKITLYGVHKDDVEIEINGKSAREFGSQGQQRSIALAMKLAEGELSKEETGEYPVFLFDDIMSELDPSRRDYIIRGIAGRQVIITTCEKLSLSDSVRFIRCAEGVFTC